MYKVLRGLGRPALVAKRVLRWVPMPLGLRVTLDATKRPAYAYGIYEATKQAKSLGLKDISVVEFGVAGGQGLVVMESLCQAAAQQMDINIKIYGFDLGTGLPAPQDYRDTPTIYQAGFFSMDEVQLRARLRDAELILGDVSDTVPTFLSSGTSPPIGFVSVDLDYYSSTREALRLFLSADYGHYLPRILVYFDDIMSHEMVYRCEYEGELLAIREFNQECHDRKICEIHGLEYTRVFPDAWNKQMYVCHLFNHPLYCKHIGPCGGQQLPLD